MRILRLAAVVAAIIGGSMALSGGSLSAAPIGAGALPLAQAADNPLVEKAQWRRRGYYRGYRPYRRYYRPRYYRPYGFYGRPRVVCRIRYTPWGPRRVCFRRW